ncbi:Transmembrane_domain-containing protein [Hexamita inflata]|uniref:Transmembrane domain-containing protein n=1 Tax=Hexamita inflata TaxID=28002 RepID=A0AA86PD51_9EUKA|nr:Transmembrane domain-containing protein [Hexamita inflata]
MINQVLLPIVIGFMMTKYGEDSFQKIRSQISFQAEYKTPIIQLITWVLEKIHIQMRPILGLALYILILLPTMVSIITDKATKKIKFLQYYLLLLDPMIHISLIYDNPFEAVQGVVMFSIIQRFHLQKDTRKFSALCLLLALMNPLYGIVLFISFAPHIKIVDSMIFSLVVPIYYYYLKFNQIDIYNFISQLYVNPKQYTMYIAALIPNNIFSTVLSTVIISVLSLSNIFKRDIKFIQSYYFFLKLANLLNIASLLYISPVILQIILISGLSFNDNFMFLIVYSSFVHISGYLILYKSHYVYNFMIGAFLIFLGLIGLQMQYLNFKLFKLKSFYFYLLVAIPISTVVFSALSRFKVLRILEESFSMAFGAVIIAYCEGKFWKD